jgi:pimeloyl-ACP methyl ester carboxylesterase
MTTTPQPEQFACFDEGSGEPVILLHSSLSSSRQWRKLQQQLGGRYRLLGLDLLGYGETPLPAATNAFSFDQEVDLVERLMDRAGTPVHLVGHSYGGAVALKAALRHPARVRSLYAHEPVLFALLKSEGLAEDWNEVATVSFAAARHVQEGRPDRAAEGFIDYWSGAGAWQKLSPDRRAAILSSLPKIPFDLAAITQDTAGLSHYRNLTMPIQLSAGDTGAQTGRRVVDLLGGVLPGSHRIIEGAGHMAPIADADRVNVIIEQHLAAHSGPRAG